ncbi:MAG: uridine kinase [Tissierellia bacterium]|nr:uridine kinase [Tissierellia bacterium]
MEDIKIIAIAGGSASGKSSIVEKIKNYFKDDLVVVSHDNYYKAHDDMSFEDRKKLNYDHPDAFDNEQFYEDLKKLKNNIDILMPTYDYKIHTRSDKVIKINAKKIILVEGILVLYDKRIRDLCDVKIFVDADSDIRLQRRIIRDTQFRDRSLESVLNQYISQVKPMHELFIEPTKKFADIIIPRGAENLVGIDMVIKHLEKMIED